MKLSKDEQIELLNNIINEIKKYDLYTYELDYDWEENPVDDYISFSVDYIIENETKNFMLEKEEKNDRK